MRIPPNLKTEGGGEMDFSIKTIPLGSAATFLLHQWDRNDYQHKKPFGGNGMGIQR